MTQAEKILQSRIRELNYMDTVIKPDKVVSLEHAKIALKIQEITTELKALYKLRDTSEIGTYTFNITNVEIREKESEIETLMKS